MNNLIISAAGSGKTTYIIEEALKRVEESILITTFTQQNYNELYSRIINRVGHIPKHITIQTWFSFIIQHGVKPYQSFLYEGNIRGLHFVSQKSGIKYYNKRRGFPVYHKDDSINHYLNKNNQIYSDKLSKFAYNVNEASEGLVVDRLNDIHSLIFVDESQDLAGYDLLLIKEFFKSEINVELVCDPRQTTYQTHFGDVLKKYKGGNLKPFIENECKDLDVKIDEETLVNSYRNNSKICEFSSLLYPEYPATESLNDKITGHDGIFFIKKSEISNYLEKYNPIQLRWDVRDSNISEKFQVLNFGESKGLGFNRVLISPTKDMQKWVSDNSVELETTTRAKFYVAITRARFSVAIIID